MLSPLFISLLLLITTSSALPSPQSPSTTSTSPPSSSSSAYVDAPGTSSSAFGITNGATIGIICGVVVIIIISVGALFFGYRKYRHRLQKRRTAMQMEEMAASINRKLVKDVRASMMPTSGPGPLVGMVNLNKGKEVTVEEEEVTVGSPVDRALSALEGGSGRVRIGEQKGNGGWGRMPHAR